MRCKHCVKFTQEKQFDVEAIFGEAFGTFSHLFLTDDEKKWKKRSKTDTDGERREVSIPFTDFMHKNFIKLFINNLKKRTSCRKIKI